jgi:tetratricopeptide (TPR) repeat protein
MNNKSAPSKVPPRFWLVPLFLFLSAFLVRLTYLNEIVNIPTNTYPVMDEKYHISLAEKIDAGETGSEPFFRAPLYPYVLAGLFKITGSSLYWSRFIQIIIGSFLPLLLYLFGMMLFNRSLAFWAAALAVFYPTFLYYDASLLITSLMVLLTLLLVWQLYRTQTGPRTRNFIISGFLLGLTGLARPNILLLGPALFIWVWLVLKEIQPVKKAVINYIILGAAAFIIILPVTIRNYVVSGDPVFIAWQGGFNFYLGNNRLSNGWSATVPGIDYTWEGGYRDAISIAENARQKPLSRSEVSDFWYEKAIDEILSDPGAFIALEFKKLRLFFNGYEIPNNQNIYFAREYAPILMPLLFDKGIYFPYGLLAPLALLGLGLTFRNWRKFLLLYLVLGSYLLSLLLFFVCARFRQPMIPLMLMLAVFAVYRLVELFRRKKYKNFALLVFILFLLILESNHDILGLNPREVRAEDYFTLGAAELEYGRTVEAELNFRRAIETDSTHGASYNNLGLIYANNKEYIRALPLFQKAIKYEPMNPENYFNYATTLMNLNEYNGAITVLEKARQLFPLNYYVYYKLGMTYYQMGRLDEAEKSLTESLRLYPDNDHARQLLGQIAGMKRQP